MSHHGIDDRDLTQAVEQTRRRLYRNALLTGSAMVHFAAAAWLLAAIAIDLLLTLPIWARVMMWAGFWLVLLASLVVGVIWPLLRRPTAAQVALRIERTLGNMHNRLLTVLDLHENGHAKEGYDRSLIRRLIEQTRQRLSGYRVEQVADSQPLRRSLTSLGVTLAVGLVLCVVLWDRVPTAAARLMMPTANIPPVTHLQFDVPGDVQVLHGDDLTLRATTTRGHTDRMTLNYRSGDGRWVRYPMQRDGDNGFVFELASVTADGEYFISAGRTWTQRHGITVVPRPVVERMQPTVHLPGYMNLPEPLEATVEDHVFAAPAGSTIELAAEVSGGAERGEIVVFESRTQTQQREVEDESVWFDDSLPGDAVTHGRWRWSDARAYSGARSHTFGWDHEPYGFRSRLNPLRAPANGWIFVYVYLHPDEPPGQVALTVADDEHAARLTWGEAAGEGAGEGGRPPLHDAELATAGVDAERIVHVHVGNLPEPGRWVRLEAPVSDLPEHMATGGARIRAMAFSIDDGRAYFDRPGALRRSTETRETTRLEQVGVEPLERESSGEGTGDIWRGRFELPEDRHYTVRFYNALDERNADVRPVRVAATEDAPPRAIVERPGRNVSLREPRTLPIAARALDDFGVAEIGVQVAHDRDALDEADITTIEIETFDTPQQRRAASTALRPDQMSPGHDLHYRFVAIDTKGQPGFSDIYRVSIVGDDSEAADDDAVDPPASLEDLVESIRDLIDPTDLSQALEQLAESLPEHIREQLPQLENGRFVDADGNPLSDEELRELFDSLYGELDDEQREQLRDFDEMLQERQQAMRDLAEQLRQQAEAAEQSPFSLPGEAESLEMAAGQLDRMAERSRGETASEGDAADLEQFAQQQQRGDEDQALGELGDDLESLEGARQLADEDFEAAEAQSRAAQARMEGRQATRSLRELEAELIHQKRQLDAVLDEQSMLNAQTEAASPERLPELAQRQDELDEHALHQVQQAREALGDPPEQDAAEAAADPDPDDPEGADAEPERQAEEDRDDSADTEPGQPADDAMAEADGDAEQPVADDTAAEEISEEDIERLREALQDRQRQLAEAVEGDRTRAGELADRTSEGVNELSSMMLQLDMAQGNFEAARAEAQRMAEAVDADPDAAAAEDPATQDARQRVDDAADELSSRVRSPDIQELVNLSRRLQGEDAEASQMAGAESGVAEGDAPAMDAGFLSEEQVQQMIMDQFESNGGFQGGYYRLSPRAQQSLLQGMRERAPAGYQSLIDAYYRELSREVR